MFTTIEERRSLVDSITQQRRGAVASICFRYPETLAFANNLYDPNTPYSALRERVLKCPEWKPISVMHRSVAILYPETVEHIWLGPWIKELKGSLEKLLVLGGVLGLLQAGIELDEWSNYGPNTYHSVFMKFLFSMLLANEAPFEKAMKPGCEWEKEFQQALITYFFAPKRSGLRDKQAEEFAETFWERLAIQSVEAGFSRFMADAAFGALSKAIAHA